MLSGLPWLIAAVYTVVAALAHPSFRLTFFGDVAQLALATTLVAAFAANTIVSEERGRWFWFLMTFGAVFWVSSQAVWSYYELWKQAPPPVPGFGGLLLFLHLAPMIAALIVMPHKHSGIPPLTALSTGMIFTWWIFLYTYLVVPWQYVHAEPQLYNNAFNSLYTIEDLVFIGLLGVWAFHAAGPWRKLYVRLLAGSGVYAGGTLFLDHLIDQNHYYTGSLYDLFFILPVAWIAFVAADFEPQESPKSVEVLSRSDGRAGVLTVLALLSVPGLLIWNQFSHVPAGVRELRSVAGLVAIIVLALLLFAKQYVLAGRLSESLENSESTVSELSKLREQLELKATHDSMTGLLNRSTVILSLERELNRAERENGRVAALLLDLDHFKSVNDNYGHHAGDTAIAFAATCMEQCVRSHDYVGRYGGEEFLIVISDCEEELARDIAERIRQRMESETVTFDGNAMNITATIGLAISDPGETSEALLRRSDAALYAGKQRGRNVVICAQDAAGCVVERFA
jgi:diguanylate cyclase (GGDEF)-like protein